MKTPLLFLASLLLCLTAFSQQKPTRFTSEIYVSRDVAYWPDWGFEQFSFNSSIGYRRFIGKRLFLNGQFSYDRAWFDDISAKVEPLGCEDEWILSRYTFDAQLGLGYDMLRTKRLYFRAEAGLSGRYYDAYTVTSCNLGSPFDGVIGFFLGGWTGVSGGINILPRLALEAHAQGLFYTHEYAQRARAGLRLVGRF